MDKDWWNVSMDYLKDRRRQKSVHEKEKERKTGSKTGKKEVSQNGKKTSDGKDVNWKGNMQYMKNKVRNESIPRREK